MVFTGYEPVKDQSNLKLVKDQSETDLYYYYL